VTKKTCEFCHEAPATVGNLCEPCEDYIAYEGGLRHCSICDGVGHGYPGGGPCPLEETGWMEADRDREMYGSY
jgi:hypothetical protein